ncbi:MAG: T9SS type A sorting domain-containing protein [bacterium]|nr:T9SS type A sorting domain-containing protein [bacterium]
MKNLKVIINFRFAVAVLVLVLFAYCSLFADEGVNLPPQIKHKISGAIIKLYNLEKNVSLSSMREYADRKGIKRQGDRIYVEVEIMPEYSDSIHLLSEYGPVIKKVESYVKLLVYPEEVFKIAELDAVRAVNLFCEFVQQNSVTGAAFDLIGGWFYHNANPQLLGQGVKIGIIDGSWKDIGESRASGDFPPANQTTTYSTSEDPFGSNDGNHGTNCCEIIYDFTPSANYYLVEIANDNPIYWFDAINWLDSVGVDLISCSVLSFKFPRNGQGALATKVNSFVSDSVGFIVAAGNYAEKHLREEFNPNGNNYHVFESGNDSYRILHFDVSDGLSLWWDLEEDNPETEYQIELYDNPQGSGTPIETSDRVPAQPLSNISFKDLPLDEYYYFKIKRLEGESDSDTLDILGHAVIFEEYTHIYGSICSPADAQDAITVGATEPHFNPTDQDSRFHINLVDSLAYYSSNGPINGLPGITKPDLVAPTLSKTSLLSSGFKGTSSSTPAVAGTIAMLLSSINYNTASEVKDYLLDDCAIPLGDNPGNDWGYGKGRLYLPDIGNDDGYEVLNDNNYSTTQNELRFPVFSDKYAQRHNLKSPGDIDWLKINNDWLRYDHIAFKTQNHNSEIITKLSLYDQTGANVLAENINFNGSQGSYLEYPLEPYSLFYLKIENMSTYGDNSSIDLVPMRGHKVAFKRPLGITPLNGIETIECKVDPLGDDLESVRIEYSINEGAWQHLHTDNNLTDGIIYDWNTTSYNYVDHLKLRVRGTKTGGEHTDWAESFNVLKIINADYLVVNAVIDPQSCYPNQLISLYGNIEDNYGNSLSDVQLNVVINPGGWIMPDPPVTDENGEFACVFRAPSNPDIYTVTVSGSYLGIYGESDYSLEVNEGLIGYDYGVVSLQTGDTWIPVGGSLNATVNYQNRGDDVPQDAVIYLRLRDFNNTIHAEHFKVDSLGAGVIGSFSHNLQASLGGPEGDYTVEAEIHFPNDNNPQDNYETRPLWVGPTTSYSKWKLTESCLLRQSGSPDECGPVGSFDYSVRIEQIYDNYGRFSILRDGDSLYWRNIYVNKPLILENSQLCVYVVFIDNDDNMIYVAIGTPTNDLTVQPIVTTGYQGETIETQLILNGTTADADDVYHLEGGDYGLGWPSSFYVNPNNTVHSVFDIPSSTPPDPSYEQRIGIDANDGNWYIAFLHIEVLEGHDVSASNINPPSGSNFTIGEDITISSTISNQGGYNEPYIPIVLTVDGPNGFADTVNDTISMNQGQNEIVEFIYPTLGFDEGTYQFTICTELSQDINSNNDCVLSNNISLNQPPALSLFFSSDSLIYNQGSTAKFTTLVTSGSDTISDAQVSYLIEYSTGDSLTRAMTWDDSNYIDNLYLTNVGDYVSKSFAYRSGYMPGESSTINYSVNNVPPETYITAGPMEGEILPIDSTLFVWQAFDLGTPPGELVYQYKFEYSGGGIYQDWINTADTFCIITDLPESSFVFFVLAEDTDGGTDPTPAQSSFNVAFYDFTISSLEFNPSNPTESDTIELSAIILLDYQKEGNRPDSAIIRFWDGEIGSKQIGQDINTSFIINDSSLVSTNWDQVEQPGFHQVIVEVDPDNILKEYNEQNNSLSQQIYIEQILNKSLYVSPSGDDTSGDGTIENPYLTIQHGIDVAITNDTIVVLPGLYIENVNFNGKNVVLTSNYIFSQDTLDIQNTVIDGDSSGTVVTFENNEDSTSVILGFTIQNGYAVYPPIQGGGINCLNSNPIIQNNIIKNNYGPYGGGIYIEYSHPIIKDNIIFNNASVGGYGGGIAFVYCDSTSEIINCTISNNSSPIKGGGIYSETSLWTLKNSIVYGNSAPDDPDIFVESNSPDPSVTYSDVLGGWAGEGNLDEDPQFVNPDNNNYNVCHGSPCLDSGDPSIQDPDGSQSDIGVYYPDHPDCGLGPHILVSLLSPYPNEIGVPISTNINVTFDIDIEPTTLNDLTFLIYDQKTGFHPGTISYDSPSKTATFDPNINFNVGNLVTVVLTDGILSVDSIPLYKGYSYSFMPDVIGSNGTFETDSIYPAGTFIHDVASADLNGDGYIDIVTANYNEPGTVSILLNNGDGTFQASYVESVGVYPIGISVADYDSDGDIDLSAAISDQADISILKNNGDGTFSPRTEYSIDGYASKICPVDIDIDGDVDIITNQLAVMINDGDGNFNHIASYLQNGGASIFAGDFNNDGLPDLTTSGNDSIYIYLNNGNFEFPTYSSFSAGASGSVYGGDLDGDVDIDIATAKANPSCYSIFWNDGTGSFPIGLVDTISGQPRSITGGDLDGDGDLDLTIPLGHGDSISILLNNGNGTFTNNVYEAGDYPLSNTIADVDGDGTLDVISGNFSAGNVAVLLNKTYVYNGPIWYVAVDSINSTEDGSPENPFRTIQGGVNAASATDTVYVLSGIYPEHVVVDKSLYLISAGGPDNTSITGNSQDSSLVYFRSAIEGEITGFTISGGAGVDVSGRGINVDSSGISISDNKITGNSSGSADWLLYGGGIWIRNSNIVLTNNEISNNSLTSYHRFVYVEGGGIHASGSIIKFYNNVISENTVSGGYGAGAYLSCDSVLMDGNTVYSNSASYIGSFPSRGGGLYITSNNITFTNNLVLSNNLSSSYYYMEPSGAIYSYGGGLHAIGDGIVSQNTFYNNKATSTCNADDSLFSGSAHSFGGGIYSEGLAIVDNIFSNNQVEAKAIGVFPVILEESAGGCYSDNDSLYYNDAWNNQPDNYNDSAYSSLMGNINANPRFVDPVNDDFHLSNNSLCVGTGSQGNDMGAIQGDYGSSSNLVIYVDYIYADSMQAGTQSYPYALIQDGINGSVSGDTVLVNNGTYIEKINFNGKNITLTSNYTFSNDFSDVENTVIDGDSSGTVVTFENGEDSTAKIIGFTIQNGFHEYPPIAGGGINCSNSEPSILYNIIKNNSGDYGGGIYVDYGHPIFRGNTIVDNSATGVGGGIAFIYCDSTSEIVNCTISNNSSPIKGGGIYSETSPWILNSSIVYGNYAPDDPEIFVESGGPDPSIIYSDVSGGWAGEGNIGLNPMFVDADSGDFSLSFNSPCIDTGDPDSMDSDGTRSDMGALYYDQTNSPEMQVIPDSISVTLQSGTLDTLALILYNNNSVGDLNYYTWGSNDSDGFMSISKGEEIALNKSTTSGDWVMNSDQKKIVGRQLSQLSKIKPELENQQGKLIILESESKARTSRIINNWKSTVKNPEPLTAGEDGSKNIELGFNGERPLDYYGYRPYTSEDTLGPEFNWIDISSIGTLIANIGDEVPKGPFDIGFSFPFYNLSYDQFWISPNGHIAFKTPARGLANTMLPNGKASPAALMPFWDNLNPAQDGQIYYYSNTIDSLIISYINVPHFSNSDTYTFQIIVTAEGNIDYQYLDMNGNVESATVGMQNQFRNMGLNIAFNEDFIEDSLAVSVKYSWIAVPIDSGTVLPMSFVDLGLQLSTLGLIEGSYNGKLSISSNDPGQTYVEVPVTVDVSAAPTPQAPTLIIPPDSAYTNEDNVKLYWSKTPGFFDSYILEGAIDPNFVYKATLYDLPDTIYTVPQSSLENITYYWRAQTVNLFNETSAFSVPYLFHRDNTLTDVTIGMVPDSLPIVILPTGGSFTYTGQLRSNNSDNNTSDVWLGLTLPGGYPYELPGTLAEGIVLNPYQFLSYGGLTQDVPGYAPSGDYLYWGFSGEYPAKYDSAGFPFTKSSSGMITSTSGLITGWECYGGWFGDTRPDVAARGGTPNVLQLPSEFSLSQSYPNPTNSQATIKYALPVDSHVKFEVYNILGQRVAVLLDEHQKAGYKSITWNSFGYSSGIYFYRLSAGDKTFTKRMTLLK